MGQHAEGIAETALLCVVAEFGKKIDDCSLAEVNHFVIHLARHGVAICVFEKTPACRTAAGPVIRAGAFHEPIGHIEMGLIPENDVGAYLGDGVHPEFHERPKLGTVHACGRRRLSVGEYLAVIEILCNETRERFASENAAHAPGIGVYFKPQVLRGLHDVLHGTRIIRQVGFGKSVHDEVAIVRDHVLQVFARVVQIPHIMIGHAGFHAGTPHSSVFPNVFRARLERKLDIGALTGRNIYGFDDFVSLHGNRKIRMR